MIYLTYDEYLSIGGSDVGLSAFNRNIAKASGMIDNATFCRIEKMSSVPVNAKHLCRDLIEYLVRNNATDLTVTSRSQSAGAVSESESYAVKTADDLQNEITGMIYDYLGSCYDDNGTPLLYRGAMR
jgi:hypothetical protein